MQQLKTPAGVTNGTGNYDKSTLNIASNILELFKKEHEKPITCKMDKASRRDAAEVKSGGRTPLDTQGRTPTATPKAQKVAEKDAMILLTLLGTDVQEPQQENHDEKIQAQLIKVGKGFHSLRPDTQTLLQKSPDMMAELAPYIPKLKQARSRGA